jgi:hypothetical protein
LLKLLDFEGKDKCFGLPTIRQDTHKGKKMISSSYFYRNYARDNGIIS